MHLSFLPANLRSPPRHRPTHHVALRQVLDVLNQNFDGLEALEQNIDALHQNVDIIMKQFREQTVVTLIHRKDVKDPPRDVVDHVENERVVFTPAVEHGRATMEGEVSAEGGAIVEGGSMLMPNKVPIKREAMVQIDVTAGGM